MTDLLFPFWIVTQRRGPISLPVEPHGMPGYIAAFSSAEKAASFMTQRGETEWENQLVSRSTLDSLIEELRTMVGMRGVCLDPTSSESGKLIGFESFLPS